MNHSNKVVVTGGAGFIGSHLVDELVKSNHVSVIDNHSADNEQFYHNDDAYYHNCDINSKNIDNIIGEADYVFHLAAEARINSCIKNPKKAVKTNVSGTLNLLETCKKYGVKRFIYSSTSAVYGLDATLPTTERAKIDCLNQYSTTKYCGEQLVELYTKMYGLDSCIFRYFNVFGERSPVKGRYAPVIGIFLKQFKRNESLTIVGDGEQRRDFVHVKDIVQANILAMGASKLNGNVFNVGTGENHSINEIAKWISSKTKKLPARTGEARHNLANISKITDVLGWRPEINVEQWVKSQII